MIINSNQININFDAIVSLTFRFNFSKYVFYNNPQNTIFKKKVFLILYILKADGYNKS